jgi:hypothetical protein
MKRVIAFCAVIAFTACGPALSASARTRLANPFDGSILRPPASIPHGRGATAPLPRPKPATDPQTAAAAQTTPPPPPAGGPVFPPVAPLE